MEPLRRLERRLGRYAVENLTFYLVAGQGLALVLGLATPGLLDYMVLVPDAVLAGQWWRLASFIFTPPLGSPIFAIFALYLLYFMGGALEAQWGAFRYNVYVLTGFLVTIAVSFVFPFTVVTNVYVTGSIFLAFAYLFPDYQILLFFVLPVKVRWLAWLTWAYYAYDFLFGDWAARLLIAAAVVNFFLFFGADLFVRLRYGQRRLQRRAREAADRVRPLHVCAVCGVTDKSDPAMEFRYCTKCEPPLAYCTEHLRNHEHVRHEH